MQAPSFLYNCLRSYFLFFAFIVTPLISMEQSSDWPTFVFTHHQEPTIFSIGPASFTISKGSVKDSYPLRRNAEELSDVQNIVHTQLIQKDIASNKEDPTFTLMHSRYMQFVEQRDQIINTCIECIYGSTTAKLQLLSLSFDIFGEKEISENINESFNTFLQAIIMEFYGDDGQLRLLPTSDHDEVARRIGGMLIELLPWDSFHSKVEEYKNAKIPGFASYYKDVHSSFRPFKMLYYEIKKFFESLFSKKKSFIDLKKLIISNPFNRDLCKLKESYAISDYAGARRIREKYRTSELQEKEKGARDERDRSELVDAYVKELVQSTGPVKRLRAIQERYKDSPVIHSISVIAEKYVTRNAMFESQVDTVKYLVTALHRTPQSRLNQKVNADDKEFAEAYDTFFDKRGLPVIFDYNEEVLKSQVIPLSLGDYGRIKERLMLFKLASLCVKSEFIHNQAFKESLKKGLQYLCRGIRDVQHAQTYHLLIEALYKSLTDPAKSSLHNILTDCDFLPSPYYEQKVHGAVLDHLHILLNALEESLEEDQEIFLYDALSALSRVWAQARDGSKEAEATLEESSPMSALVKEGFLIVPHNYEKAHNKANYLLRRMDELGFNKIITANAYAMSASALQKIEAQCSLLLKEEAVPNFTTITAIMHDAYTPKPVTRLLKNALDIWYEAENSHEVREIAFTATLCAEAAYHHHKEDDHKHYKVFLRIGKGLCKYALIFGQVVVDKVANTFQTVAAISKFAVNLCAQSTPRFLQPLVDDVDRFTNAISGKGFQIPQDYFSEEQRKAWIEKTAQKQGPSIQEYLELFGKAIEPALVLLIRIGGADADGFPDLQAEINAETCKIIEGYVQRFMDLSPEEQFKIGANFALDFILPHLTFRIASWLAKILYGSIQTWIDIQKTAFGGLTGAFEEGLVPAYEVGAELVKATDKSLIPQIMNRARGAATRGAPWLKLPNFQDILNAFALKVIDLELKYGKDRVQKTIKILHFDDSRIIERIEEAILNNSKIKCTSELLEEMIKHLIKIDSNPRWSLFKLDPSKKNTCSLTSIEEALAGIACEEQGLLHNLIRDQTGGGEFIDYFKRCWDVKIAKSYALTGKYIFDEKGKSEFISSLKKALERSPHENFILNISFLETADHPEFFMAIKIFSKELLERMIVVDYFNPKNSKTTQELLKFLGK